MFSTLPRQISRQISRQIPVALTATAVCAVFAAGPTVAQAAVDAVNADTVDGKHAVGAGASVSARKGKLVATSGASGRLPSNIIDTSGVRTTGDGREGSFVNIDSCGSGPVLSYAVTLQRASRIFAAASSGYGRGSGGPDRPSITVQLLDAGGTVVARSNRVVEDGSTGNPSLAVAGMLVAAGGNTAFVAPAGGYTLRIFGNNFGTCASFGQYQSPQLSHLAVPAG
jgi:hypothetical protein